MLQNYLKIALRNINRQKGYSFLNVAGLAIGMAACLLIYFFVRNELSYDTYHSDADRLYRVAIDIQGNTANRVFAKTSAPLGPALKKDFPQVENAVRLWKQDNKLVNYGQERSFYEDNFYLVDPQVFEVFTIPLIKGDPNTALSRPSTVVISEEAAKKYFAEEEPIGKVLKVNNEDFEVTGVMQRLPHNSHLKFNLITSLATLEKVDWYKQVAENWFSTMFYTYIKVKEHVDIRAFESQIAQAANPYVGDQLKEWESVFHYFLQPVKNIHLHSDLHGEAEAPGNATNVYIFTVVAFLILLIACLNYINLTTAQSTKRAKEVGVRKVIGAAKTSLVIQFFCESLLLTFLALVFALWMVFLVRPLFEALSGQTFYFETVLTPQFMVSLIGLTILIGIGAAIYPAMVLSSFRPVQVLKGNLGLGTKGTTLRQVLVVSQFSVSLMLIVGTMMVYRQLNFMKDQHLGFDQEQVLVLPIRGGVSIADRYEQIKHEFQSHPSIAGVAASSTIPGRDVDNFATSLIGEDDDKGQSMYYLFADFDFLQTLEISMAAGRPFSKAIQTDAENSFVINEKAVRAFGWATPEEAIGKKLSAGFGREGEIIGVYKDFHYRSLEAPIEPLVLAIQPGRFRYLSLRLTTGDIPETMAFVQQKWQELFPQSPYEYSFLDEEFNRQYSADEKTGRTFLLFTSIAIFIACLGLFGLATFMAEQRTKEIGIRKVLGASVLSILTLLSKDFTKLILLAILVATPISWYALSRWLEGFAYRVDLGPGIFVLAGVIAMVTALATVSWQSVKAALMNPVKSLRSE